LINNHKEMIMMTIKPQAYTLKNGLTIIMVDTKTFPTLTTMLLVGAGSRFENSKNNGIAHFFEHMAFKGSKKYPNSFIISSTIESLGGVFNAFTSKDYTGYWIKATNEHFDTVIDVLSDMVLNPLLVDEEINREKGVIVEEINMYQDMPMQKVGEVFETLLYKNNPLGYEITGTKKTVSNFNRQMFVDYISSLYHPNNATLIIAGGLGKKDYLKIVEDKFNHWLNKQESKFLKVEEEQTKPEVFFQTKKIEQTHFCLGFRAYSLLTDKRKKAALSLLSVILGGGMSSRLFIQVRERRGLCYYVSTSRESYVDVGNFVTQAGVSNNTDKIKLAIETILKEHKKIISEGIAEDELKKAKELIKGRLYISLEDSFNIAAYFGRKILLERKLEQPTDMIKVVEQIKADEIITVAKEIFKPEKLNLAMISPFEKNQLQEIESTLNI